MKKLLFEVSYLAPPSFIPPPVIREFQELTRYRESVVREQSAVANRIQKLLESGNLKLGQVASDALGVSGRLILKALATGESDARKLAALARGKLKEKSLSLEQALQGRLREVVVAEPGDSNKGIEKRAAPPGESGAQCRWCAV